MMVVVGKAWEYTNAELYVVGVPQGFIKTIQQHLAPEPYAARTETRIEASLEKVERTSGLEEENLSNAVIFPFSNIDGTGVCVPEHLRGVLSFILEDAWCSVQASISKDMTSAGGATLRQ